jgi:uncharacterized protein
MAGFAFGGHDFHIVGDKALFWLARRALVVADLHLEKASWFAERGQMLPPYDSRATLERIAALVDEVEPTELWCLGDNFHDLGGPGRLEGQGKALLRRLTNAVNWHWITGNHDEVLPADIGGQVHDVAEVDGLLLRHQADPLEVRPELSGHFHPKVRVSARGRSVSRPCFMRGETKLIFPSFGALTGGLWADHPEIRSVMGGKTEALLMVQDQLLRYPIS